MSKIITAQAAANMVQDGQTVMMGGFLAVGAPDSIINALISSNVKNIKFIGNDTATPDKGVGKLVVNKQIKHATVSHIGTNKETVAQMNAGEIEVTLVPQGTLVERIRAAGCGLGGILTPTGINTLVAEGKQVIELDGREYLLEQALGAEIAFIKAHKADKNGNLVYRYLAKNFNPTVAMAAPIVVAEVDEIVEVGEIEPDEVETPAIFIDYIVKSEVLSNGL